MAKKGTGKLFFSILCTFALVLLISTNSVSATGIDSEINKITSYAEEYESGNINYAQLLVYLSNTREKMNSVMGVIEKQEGGILKEEQLRAVLGKETEKTKWAWNERKMREEKQKDSIPVWRKIVFDGNKIQIWLNAWPSIFGKNGRDELVYRLDVRLNFKKTQDKFSLDSEIQEIKELAEEYSKNPSNENANNLAKKSVTAERKFEELMKNGREKCELYMDGIFGTENKMSKQKTIVREVDFYSGDNFDVIMRLEMCDDCEWHWIGLDFWIDSRGMFEQPKEPKFEKMNINLESMTSEDFKREIKSIFEEIERDFSNGDINSAYELKAKLRQYGEAWNQKSNDAWKQVDKIFEAKRNVMTENPDRNDPYYWVKEEQERRKMVASIANQNYQEIKKFYLDLLSKYESREYIFNQVTYEKRLVEIFGEFGREVCTNNKDDNNDGNIDCSDETCNGKICGTGEVEVSAGNESTKETRNLYCIMKECKAKEEIVTVNESICGNHICEANEAQTCSEDCAQCKQYDAINCSGKVIFKGNDANNCPLEPICLEENFSCSINEDCSQPLCGKAECVEGTCIVSSLEECREAECNEGQEKVMNCADGNEIISEKCFDGIWKETGVECTIGTAGDATAEIKEEVVTGNKCVVKEDCGSQDDVCSNGECVTIPKQEEAVAVEGEIIIEEAEKEDKTEEQSEESTQSVENQQSGEEVSVSDIREEIIEEPKEESSPVEEEKEQESQSTEEDKNEEESSSSEESESGEESIAGNVIKSIKKIGFTIKGFVVNGFQTEDSSDSSSDSSSSESEGSSESSSDSSSSSESSDSESEGESSDSEQTESAVVDNEQEQSDSQEDDRREDEERRDRENEERREDERERREEDEKRRNEECERMCTDNCERNIIVPCVQKCVFDSKCKTGCNDEIESCKIECKEEKDTAGCESDCTEKCKKGEAFNMQPEQMNKFEEAVFKAGGQCRISPERIEGGLWFDGWGAPFEDLRYLKQEYYSSGSNDWCKNELEDYLKQRKEFERSMNSEFLVWFFEKYMANTAEDWEEHVSGIYELYWKDVDLSREIARTTACGKVNTQFSFNLINIKYETEYGKIEFWEEMKTIKMLEFGNKEMTVISPYMKIWIFPPKEFIIYEMKKAMTEHKFPGGEKEQADRENQDGPTEEEKEQIKQNEAFMNVIKKMDEKYGGAVDGIVQLKNNEDIVFNLYVNINENDIIKMKPMLPEESPQEDIKIEIDFDKIYNFIHDTAKEMDGERTEMPPWDKKESVGTKINDVKNAVGIYFKVKDILNSAKITPEAAEKDVRKMLNKFFAMMMKMDKGGDKQEDVSEKLDEASAEDFKEIGTNS